MKPGNTARVFAALLWSLTGILFIAIGLDLFYRDNISLSFAGSSVNSHLAIGYTIAGILFIAESALTFYRKKLALILSIPVGIFTVVPVVAQLDQFVEDGMIPPEYLMMYGTIFLMSTLATVVVLWARESGALPNA